MGKDEKDPRVLEELARTWRLPDETRVLLSNSPIVRVYCAIAESPQTVSAILADIYKRHPGDCDYVLALNSNTPPALLDALAETKTVPRGYNPQFAEVIRNAARTTMAKQKHPRPGA
jgi:hypothetical protein